VTASDNDGVVIERDGAGFGGVVRFFSEEQYFGNSRELAGILSTVAETAFGLPPGSLDSFDAAIAERMEEERAEYLAYKKSVQEGEGWAERHAKIEKTFARHV